jgi:hypothetical protein
MFPYFSKHQKPTIFMRDFSCSSQNGSLVDVHLTNFNTWIMFKNEKDSVQLRTIPINDLSQGGSLPNEITIIGLDENENVSSKLKHKNKSENDDNSGGGDDDDEEEDLDEERLFDKNMADLDVKEIYLKLIFEPFRFSKSNIIKSLGVYIVDLLIIFQHRPVLGNLFN